MKKSNNIKETERRLLYLEDDKTGKITIEFEGVWTKSSIDRVLKRIPKHYLDYKRQILKAAEEENKNAE